MAKRGMPKGARSLSDLLDEREQWKVDVGRTFTAVRGGQSQRTFAKKLKVSQPYLSQIENGYRTPSEKTLRKLQALTKGARDGDRSEE